MNSLNFCFKNFCLLISTKFVGRIRQAQESRLVALPKFAAVRWFGQNTPEKPNEEDVDVDRETKSLLDEFNKRALPKADMRVFVVQPNLKSKEGSHKNKKSDIELMLDESVALVQTLPGWSVVDTSLTHTYGMKKTQLFGSGTLASLSSDIRKSRANAVFVNVDVLTPGQIQFLFNAWHLQIFDRYHIVLLIFKTYAKTKEAKLQIALAEIPYLSARVEEMTTKVFPDTLNMLNTLGGHGFKTKQEIKDIVTERRVRIEKALEKIRNHRQLRRDQVKKRQLPIIAVVGYTNSGKTSLIKCLTHNEKMTPEDRLFATLDVTLHVGVLPSSRIKAYFADTVGFVSNIPTSLIASFESTLEDVVHANLIVHVRDISHPDTEAQKQTVLRTLKNLNLPDKLMNNIIEVRNKVDRVEDTSKLEPLDSNCVNVSCTESIGLHELSKKMDMSLKVLENYVTVVLKIPNGGEELRFLERNAGISKYETSKDGNFLFVETTLQAAVLKQFLAYFGNLIQTSYKMKC